MLEFSPLLFEFFQQREAKPFYNYFVRQVSWGEASVSYIFLFCLSIT